MWKNSMAISIFYFSKGVNLLFALQGLTQTNSALEHSGNSQFGHQSREAENQTPPHVCMIPREHGWLHVEW